MIGKGEVRVAEAGPLLVVVLLLYAASYACFLLVPAAHGLLAALLYISLISFGEIFAMPFSSTWVRNAVAVAGSKTSHHAWDAWAPTSESVGPL